MFSDLLCNCKHILYCQVGNNSQIYKATDIVQLEESKPRRGEIPPKTVNNECFKKVTSQVVQNDSMLCYPWLFIEDEL